MNLKKQSMLLMIAMLVSKMTGFLREVVLANYFGTSFISDAYILSTNIPVIIYSSIGTALATSFIPVYSKVAMDKGEDEAIDFTNNVLKIVIIASLAMSIVGVIFNKNIVQLFGGGFSNDALKLTQSFTLVLIPSMVFVGISNIQGSYLQIKGKYNVFGVASILPNIAVIISIVLAFYLDDLNVLSWGTFLSYVIMVVFYYPFMKKNSFRPNLKLTLINDNVYIKQLFTLMLPIILSVSINQINLMINRSLASGLAEGSIAAINYADKIRGMIIGVFIVSITTVLYPKLSKLKSEGNEIEFKKEATSTVTFISYIAIPISLYMMFFSKEIVKMLFERGAFDSVASRTTSEVLLFFSMGLMGYSLIEVTNRVFYSLKDTKTPLRISLLTVSINIILTLALVKGLKANGLALANSMSTFISSLVSLYILKKRDVVEVATLFKNILKITVFSTIIFGLARYLYLFYLSGKDTNYSLMMFIIISAIAWLLCLVAYYFISQKNNND